MWGCAVLRHLRVPVWLARIDVGLCGLAAFARARVDWRGLAWICVGCDKLRVFATICVVLRRGARAKRAARARLRGATAFICATCEMSYVKNDKECV